MVQKVGVYYRGIGVLCQKGRQYKGRNVFPRGESTGVQFPSIWIALLSDDRELKIERQKRKISAEKQKRKKGMTKAFQSGWQTSR